MNDPEPESIKLTALQPGPIRHESLSLELLDQVQAVYDLIGPFLGTTLERFELNLMRDSDPEQEVAIWYSITAAWISYHDKYLGAALLTDDEEEKLIAALIAISTGANDINRFGVPEPVGQLLLNCYDQLGAECPQIEQIRKLGMPGAWDRIRYRKTLIGKPERKSLPSKHLKRCASSSCHRSEI
ncbi:hypothetical protein [Stieleria mannarensis]|uniref:hypothetical protein n=1 Tax=Stieleria mannarensis TaxID=2755585 RepID=UPI001603BC59|nr:hypothetical protein [Rhodopirellula sp. JC639]